MSEQIEKGDILEIDLGPQRVDSTWILLHGRTGLGKTLYMTGIVHACVKFWASLNHAKILLITNYHIYKLPESVTVFRSGSVREIMEKMMSCEGTGTRVIVAIDEINNTLSSKQSATNMSTWLTRVASNARKYGVVAFIFSTQGKKASDYRLRVNCTYFVRPRGDVNVDSHPQATWWNDSGEWDVDTTHAKRDIFGNPDYQYGVPIPSDYELVYLRDAYNTQEVLPIELDPTISETEAPILTERFIKWSSTSEVGLDEMNKSDVKEMIHRWNRSEFVIPYSPAGEQVVYTELLKRGLLKQKEIFQSHPDSSDRNSGAAKEPGTTFGDKNPDQVKQVNEVKTESFTSLPKKNPMVGFCCGKMQSNIYTHRKSKRHLKSVEAGVAEAVDKNEGQRTNST